MEGRRRGRSRHEAYNSSVRGVARNLRCEHDMDRAESEEWARRLFNPASRCAICGLPTYLIAAYRRSGWPFFLGKRSGAGSHPRLTLDHVVPGRREGGYRLLCFACNSLRGARRFTDEEVLQAVRDKWMWLRALRFLWWLNTSPGIGGRLHRSVRCAKRDAQYAGGAVPSSEQSAETSTP